MVADVKVPVERRFVGEDGYIIFSGTSHCVTQIDIFASDNRTAVMILLHEVGHQDVFALMDKKQKEAYFARLYSYQADSLNSMAPRTIKAIQRDEIAAWRRALELKSKFGLNSKEFNRDLQILIKGRLGTYADRRGYSADEMITMVYK